MLTSSAAWTPLSPSTAASPQMGTFVGKKSAKGKARRTPTPLEAFAEEIAREEAAQDLCAFGEYVYPWWRAHDMHRAIAKELQDVIRFLETDGEEGNGRLMILTPPQHGKSEETSRLLPAFALGKIPDLRVFLISYGADLAVGNSRAVRNLVLSQQYQAVFGAKSASEEPVMLSSDSRSSAAWDLAQPHRGGVLATGVNGSISGRAKGLAIIDDPIKNHKEAQSDDVRNDAWEFWVSSIRPRALAAILIMTHWHPDDPAGRAMREMILKAEGDNWRILMLPALAFEPEEYAPNLDAQRAQMLEGVYVPMADPLGRLPGEALCPPMMNRDQLLKTRETDDFYFTSLYQQLPYEKAGQRYKREWLQSVTQIPEKVTLKYVVRFWDKANSTKGDFTAGVLFGYGSDGIFYMLDVVRGKWSSYERDQMMRKTTEQDAEKYGHVYIWHQQDPGSAGKDSAEATNRVLMGFPVKFETVTGDKETRSEPLESAFQGGLVKLLQGAWNFAFIEECVSFPRGRNDDQVDAASSAYNKLIEMIGNDRPKQKARSWQG